MARTVKPVTLSSLYRAWKAAESAWKAAQSAAIGDLPNGSHVTDPDATVTVVRGTRRTTDYAAASARLSPAMLKRVSKVTIDADALTALHDAGKISDEDFAAILTVSNNAPYLKVTLR